MIYTSIDDLRSHLGGGAGEPLTPAYRAKMLHALPAMPTVDRDDFIVKRCTGKRVLDCGASGALHEQIVAVAAFCLGVDREDGIGVLGFDLDTIDHAFPGFPEPAPDLIVAGELLEHLSNPGHFLTRLWWHYRGVPLIVTVPNAYNLAGLAHLKRGEENVNVDHVAWYSPRTLRTLLERHGYRILDWACYKGTAPTAEGLIAVAV